MDMIWNPIFAWIPVETIVKNVIFDSDVATLYGMGTREINQLYLIRLSWEFSDYLWKIKTSSYFCIIVMANSSNG